ncbi:hypothetical protein ANACOL_00111 [Anaerotruncus colihominis DSM 17241]|uniref:Uncharacterized protein n=1 Tax=Anaerotruncus colihominis DSM 17241 TaxID=445972 RepID=B0P5T8_9FIRM|nr:hypothetical protein ANACOL_00111 [Anaerotruncus colihominis DSM 17241]
MSFLFFLPFFFVSYFTTLVLLFNMHPVIDVLKNLSAYFPNHICFLKLFTVYFSGRAQKDAPPPFPGLPYPIF